MPDRNELIASLKGRIWGGEIHKGGYIHVPQEEAEAILELLKAQEPVPPLSRIEVTPEGTSFVIDCGACKTELVRVQRGASFNDVQENVKYCIRCGKAVKWDA